jgi:hypothetical protein
VFENRGGIKKVHTLTAFTRYIQDTSTQGGLKLAAWIGEPNMYTAVLAKPHRR